MMKVFHHDDADGRVSAYWILSKYGDKVKLIESDYGKKMFNLNSVDKGDIVWLLDYSIPPKTMKELLKKTNKVVVWIDHHESAIQDYKDFPYNLKGIRKIGDGACLLTWSFVNKEPDLSKAPYFLKLLSDWDVFGGKYNNTELFHFGCCAENTEPTSKLWPHLNNNPKAVKKILENGKIILKYYKNDAKRLLKMAGFEAEIDGHKAICLNFKTNSKVFDSVKDGYDVMVVFVYDGERYQFSVFSDNDGIDVSKIAKKYGGGGHKESAGFSSENLAMLKNIKKL